MIEPGNIVLINMLQSDGNYKLRPALILKKLPKYNDLLVCGISSQLGQYIEGYDEILKEDSIDFIQTGLKKSSVIRLFFIAVVPNENISGSIGSISSSLHQDLLNRLARFLTL